MVKLRKLHDRTSYAHGHGVIGVSNDIGSDDAGHDRPEHAGALGGLLKRLVSVNTEHRHGTGHFIEHPGYGFSTVKGRRN